jgi:hypothetical protein
MKWLAAALVAMAFGCGEGELDDDLMSTEWELVVLPESALEERHADPVMGACAQALDARGDFECGCYLEGSTLVVRCEAQP